MRIGELAELTGVDVETIRYYEKSGLLSSPTRAANGYRIYGAAQLERLAFVRHCRALDMPLAEVSRLLDFLDHPVSSCGDVNVLVDSQLARVRARLKSMRALESNWWRYENSVLTRRRRTIAGYCMNWYLRRTATRAHVMQHVDAQHHHERISSSSPSIYCRRSTRP